MKWVSWRSLCCLLGFSEEATQWRLRGTFWTISETCLTIWRTSWTPCWTEPLSGHSADPAVAQTWTRRTRWAQTKPDTSFSSEFQYQRTGLCWAGPQGWKRIETFLFSSELVLDRQPFPFRLEGPVVRRTSRALKAQALSPVCPLCPVKTCCC